MILYHGTYNGEKYDLIIGAVANDDVYRTLQVYSGRIINKRTSTGDVKNQKVI